MAARNTKECASQALPQRTLMLLGKTGAGKSSLGNAILGLSGDDSFTVTAGMCPTSVYSAVSKEAQVHDRLVKVVDTPGLMDATESGKKKVVQGISDGITHCYEGVDAFLIVLELNNRLTDQEWKTVDELGQLFGETFWKYVIVVFTHGDSIQNSSKLFDEQINEGKQKLPQLKRLFERVSKKSILVDASTKCEKKVASAQIRKLLDKVDMTVASNLNRKYTNYIFSTVKESLLTKKTMDLERQLQDAKLKIQELEDKNSQLEVVQADDRRRIESLEKTVKDALDQLEKLTCAAVEKALDAIMAKECAVMESTSPPLDESRRHWHIPVELTQPNNGPISRSYLLAESFLILLPQL